MTAKEGSPYLELSVGPQCDLTDRESETLLEGSLVGKSDVTNTQILVMFEGGNARNFHSELVRGELDQDEVTQVFADCPCHIGQKVGKGCLALAKLKEQEI